MSLCECVCVCEPLALAFYTLHTVCCWHRWPYTAALSLLVFGAGSWRVQEDATLLVNVPCVVLSQGPWLALLMGGGPWWETALARGGSGLPWQESWVYASGMSKCFPVLSVGCVCPFLLVCHQVLEEGGADSSDHAGLSFALAWLGILMIGSLPPPIPATSALGAEGLGQACPF